MIKRFLAAMAISVLLTGCADQVTSGSGRALPGRAATTGSTPASTNVAFDDSLCALMHPLEIGRLVGETTPGIAHLTAFRMRPPAEDGCIVGYPALTVAVSVSIGPASRVVLDARSLDDQNHGLDPTSLRDVGDAAYVSDGSAVGLVGDVLIDVTLTYNRGVSHRTPRGSLEQLLRNATSALPRLTRPPALYSDAFCDSSTAAAALVLGAMPTIRRGGRQPGNTKSCGWGTTNRGIQASAFAVPDAATLLDKTAAMTYRGTLLSFIGGTFRAAADASHIIEIDVYPDDTANIDEIYVLFEALKDSLI